MIRDDILALERDDLIGHHCLPNGWKAWAWDANGDAPDDPEGWLTEDEARDYLLRVAAY